MRVQITFRLTREDHRRFCRLVTARVTEDACGWCTSPPVLVAASIAMLAVLGLVHRLFGDLIGDAGVVIVGLAYLSGVLSALLLVWSLQRRYLRHVLDDSSPLLAEARLRLG